MVLGFLTLIAGGVLGMGVVVEAAVVIAVAVAALVVLAAINGYRTVAALASSHLD